MGNWMVYELYLNKSITKKNLGYNSRLKYILLYTSNLKMENMILMFDRREIQEINALVCSC